MDVPSVPSVLELVEPLAAFGLSLSLRRYTVGTAASGILSTSNLSNSSCIVCIVYIGGRECIVYRREIGEINIYIVCIREREIRRNMCQYVL